jgi:hypothetical protein
MQERLLRDYGRPRFGCGRGMMTDPGEPLMSSATFHLQAEF